MPIERERPGLDGDSARCLKTNVAPTNTFSDALMTVEDVAEILRVPVSWVYERLGRRSRDRIPGFKLGKYWRFREVEVLAWVEDQRVGTKPSA